MASLKQTFQNLKKGMSSEQLYAFISMVGTSVNMGAKNSSNTADKDLAEHQLHLLAKRAKECYKTVHKIARSRD